MKIHFWGTRGSLPASVTSGAIRKKIVSAFSAARGISFRNDIEIERFLDARVATGELPFSTIGAYGVNTSCMEVAGGNEYVLCDAGTGIRDFGDHLLRLTDAGPSTFHIFMSHLHWDHIQGFPFFGPAYRPGNRINIYGLHKELEKAFTGQQEYPYFPVPLKAMAADIRFVPLKPDREYEIAGFAVRAKTQDHPGISYGYRFEREGKALVYSTDCEHKGDAFEGYAFLDFFAGADLLVFEAQYPLLEAISSKENWGHSSNIMAVEFSVRAGVKRLCLFHNDPAFDDESLDKFLDDTRRYLKIYAESSPLRIDLAYDGLEIEL